MYQNQVLTSVMLVVNGATLAQVPYATTPDWESANPHYSTGGALVDLNRDGWLDLVVSDGNDITPGRLNVYYNDGAGNLPTIASWQSADTAYNGHLDVADVNGDGWMDVAVACLGRYDDVCPIARVYLNNAGTLSSLADWTADIVGNAFGVAFGDVNLDGRPDLAVATGWAYSPQQYYHNSVYLNVAGTLEATASWSSANTDHLQGVLWVDADDDGDLDLVGAGSGGPSRMFINTGGTLETTASWNATDVGAEDAIMAAAGDVTGDGVVDLLLTDNTQLSGSGRFRLYRGNFAGVFDATYTWSYYEGYGSAVALADVDADGALDLATGGWWEPSRIFRNTGLGFAASPTLSSSVTSVIEKIVFGDLDPPCGVVRRERISYSGGGGRQLFHLPRRAIQSVDEVVLDGTTLTPDQYTASRADGWISVYLPPTSQVEVDYSYSNNLDMVITNWDSGVGNFIYHSALLDDCNDNGTADGCDIDSGTSTDVNANGIPDECEDMCPEDLVAPVGVEQQDLNAVLNRWGDPECLFGGPAYPCPEDLVAPLGVEQQDLNAVLNRWGDPDCEPADRRGRSAGLGSTRVKK